MVSRHRKRIEDADTNTCMHQLTHGDGGRRFGNNIRPNSPFRKHALQNSAHREPAGEGDEILSIKILRLNKCFAGKGMVPMQNSMCNGRAQWFQRQPSMLRKPIRNPKICMPFSHMIAHIRGCPNL